MNLRPRRPQHANSRFWRLGRRRAPASTEEEAALLAKLAEALSNSPRLDVGTLYRMSLEDLVSWAGEHGGRLLGQALTAKIRDRSDAQYAIGFRDGTVRAATDEAALVHDRIIREREEAYASGLQDGITQAKRDYHYPPRPGVPYDPDDPHDTKGPDLTRTEDPPRD